MSLAGQYAAASQVSQLYLEKKLKVLAFDFDLTIVDIHTQGAWMGSADTLALQIQPWAKVLIKCYQDSLSKINKIAVCTNTGLQCVPYLTNSDLTQQLRRMVTEIQVGNTKTVKLT